MRFTSFIAKRYFFSKSKWNVVNIISVAATSVLIIASCSFFVVLSVFSGLKGFGASYSLAFDADITIFSKNEKFFNYSSLLDTILGTSGLKVFSLKVSEKVAVQNEGNTSFVKMIGVDDNYNSVYEIESLIETGKWLSEGSTINESVVSFDLADQLNLGLYNYGGGINVLIPNLKKNSFFSRPFNSSLHMVSGVFSSSDLEQKNTIYLPLDNARDLLGLDAGLVSSVGLKADEPSQIKNLVKSLKSTLTDNFFVKTREELDETYYKMIKSEEIILNLVMGLILIVAIFNSIGALIILVVEKQKDIEILKKIGAANKDIQVLFFKHGLFMTLSGGVLGLILGAIIVYIQQALGVIKLSGTQVPYPVNFEALNLLTVFLWVTVVGSLAAAVSVLSVKKIRQ